MVARNASKGGATVETEARRQRVVTRPFVWFVAIAFPIFVFMFTQLGIVQNAEGWLIHDLTAWDLGKKDILADLFAPIGVLSIVVISVLNRRLLGPYGAELGE